MFTEKFVQAGNSCAAATLMIALCEFDKSNKVDQDTEAKLYAQTCDKALSEALGKSNKNDYYSSPEKIIDTATKNGLTAKLYVLDDIKGLTEEVSDLKSKYIDSLKPKEVKSEEMKKLLDSGPLQLLCYVDGDMKTMHWLLLRKSDGAYYLYDTAYGTNTKVDPDTILGFNAKFTAGRQNNFFGVAIHLTPKL